MAENMNARVMSPIITADIAAILLNVMKMRRYNRRIEILTRPLDVIYSIWMASCV
jgi:hypothetical protein